MTSNISFDLRSFHSTVDWRYKFDDWRKNKFYELNWKKERIYHIHVTWFKSGFNQSCYLDSHNHDLNTKHSFERAIKSKNNYRCLTEECVFWWKMCFYENVFVDLKSNSALKTIIQKVFFPQNMPNITILLWQNCNLYFPPWIHFI